jgi:hypothetical protein
MASEILKIKSIIINIIYDNIKKEFIVLRIKSGRRSLHIHNI